MNSEAKHFVGQNPATLHWNQKNSSYFYTIEIKNRDLHNLPLILTKAGRVEVVAYDRLTEPRVKMQ